MASERGELGKWGQLRVRARMLGICPSNSLTPGSTHLSHKQYSGTSGVRSHGVYARAGGGGEDTVTPGKPWSPGLPPSHPASTLPPGPALTSVTILMPILMQMMRPSSNRMELPRSWQLLVLGL